MPDQNSVGNTPTFQLLLCNPQAFSVSHSAIPVSRLGVDKSLGGDTATGQLTPADQRDVPHRITARSAIKGREVFESSCCLESAGGEWLLLHCLFWGVELRGVLFFSTYTVFISTHEGFPLAFALRFSSWPFRREVSKWLGAYLPAGVSPAPRGVLGGSSAGRGRLEVGCMCNLITYSFQTRRKQHLFSITGIQLHLN